MSTVIRNSLSKKNPYYISKHRYLELKHYCLQFDEWKTKLNSLGVISGFDSEKIPGRDFYKNSPVEDIAIKRMILEKNIRTVKEVCYEADSSICDYIFLSVTKGYSYVYLSSILNIPCSKDYFYERYRKFFKILDSVRR